MVRINSGSIMVIINQTISIIHHVIDVYQHGLRVIRNG